jgi:hypothetical protein
MVYAGLDGSGRIAKESGMTDRHGGRWWSRVPACVIAGLLIYVFGIGPAVRIAQETNDDTPYVLYRPLFGLAEKSKTTERLMWWYIYLWGFEETG